MSNLAQNAGQGSAAKSLGWTLGACVAVALSRGVFIGSDMGLDYDAWLLADAAREIGRSGEYAAARPPGSPVVEGLFALLHGISPRLLPIATGVASVLVMWLTSSLLARTQADAGIQTGLCVCFAPVVWVASVGAMDYMFAWCLALMSWVAADRCKPTLAGIALGLGMAARIATGLMGLPLLWLMWRRSGLGPAVRMGLITLAVAGACFTPGLRIHGYDWMTSSAGGVRDGAYAVHLFVDEAWGRLGFICFSLALIAHRALDGSRPVSTDQRDLQRVAGLGAGTCLLLFGWMPFEAGYLIPLVACVCMALGVVARPLIMSLLTVGLIASSLVTPGALPAQATMRENETELIDRTLEAIKDIEEPTILLCGRFFSRMRYELGGTQYGPVQLKMAVADRQLLLDTVATAPQRYRFINTLDPWHRANNGYSLWEAARPLLPLDWRQSTLKTPPTAHQDSQTP